MIKTTYLQMNGLEKLRCPVGPSPQAEELHLARTTCPVACAAMFSEVGRPFFWEIDRFGWTRNYWARHLSARDVEAFFLVKGRDENIGYLEIKMHAGAKIEIVYFGLLPQHVGRGLGGHALSLAVKSVFGRGFSGIWLHTSSLDHVAALSNYYARGFEFVKEELADGSLLLQTPMLDPQQG